MSPLSRIRADLSGVPNGKWERRAFMVVQGFFDDSGNSPDQELLVVGGLLATAEQWIAFTTAWEAALAKPPGADFVKYREIVRGEGQFADERGWTNDACCALLSELAEIMKTHCIGYVFSAMYHRDFEKYIQSIPTAFRSLLNDTPFVNVAMKIMGPTLGMMIKQDISDKCDFYFDTAQGPDALMQELWPSIKELPKSIPIEELTGKNFVPEIGSLRFENELDFKPLQGADIIAGMIRDVLLTQQTHRSLKALENMPWGGDLLDEDSVRQSGDMLQERMARLLEMHPNARLIGYDPKTAARTRKYLRRFMAEREKSKR